MYDDGICTDSIWDFGVLHWVAYIAFWKDTNSSVCFLPWKELGRACPKMCSAQINGWCDHTRTFDS